jgi:Tol biopolymer transport system component
MNADPEIRERLIGAVAHIDVDTEAALARFGQMPRASRVRLTASFAIAAALALIAVVFIAQRQTSPSGFVGPKGLQGTIAYGERDARGTRLFALDVTTGERSLIATPPGNITAAQWSPDGRRIAYTLEEERGSRYALVVALADGSSPVRIVEREKGDPTLPGPDFISVSWSPDGTQIAYSGRTIARGRTVSVLDAGGGPERVLPGHWESVSWSPDGRHLLLIGFPDGNPRRRPVGVRDEFDLYRARPDGTDLVRLTNDEPREFNAQWSPDGSRIVFARGDADNQKSFDIFVMNADGSGERALTDDEWFDGVPAWSADGEWIVFSSNRDSGGTPRNAADRTSLYLIRPDGTEMRRVLRGDTALYALSWTS